MRLAAVLVMIFAATAAAQGIVAPGAADSKAAADKRFYEGKQLLADGQITAACAKFEASLQLFDQFGTRLNVADCYEAAGRTASAWAAFRDAASIADQHRDPRAAYARDRAAKLQPKRVKLAIAVPPASRARDLHVTRNGTAVPPEQFGAALPVDPGLYTIAARAPDRQPWSTTVAITVDGSETRVEVPALADVPAHAPRPEPPRDALRGRRHRLAYAVGAAGLVGLGASAALGIAARRKWHDADEHCAGEICDATGLEINRDARSLGTTGTIIGGIGLATVAAAGVIYLTAPVAAAALEHAGVTPLPHGGAMVSWTGVF